MKRIMFFVVVVAIALSSCKSSKKQPAVQYTPPDAQPKVFTVPETTEAAAPAAAVEDKTVSLRKESVTFTDAADKSGNEANTYFVILGSFGQLENAKNFRETLLNEGFTPIILHSETGYYRVCVNSYKGETEARGRVREIRQAFPKYADLWLLIKQ
jgi:cell division protein FtsN